MEDTSYTIVTRFVNLNDVMRGVRHSYSESDTLIKYSEEQYSPVSSKPSDSLQLGAPSLYKSREESCEKNSGLVADDSEGKIRETLNWRKDRSRGMEILKKRLTESTPAARDNVKVDVTWKVETDFWLYCTSIDPGLSHKRIEQMKRTCPKYNFMTKINKPSSFAEQLGNNFGAQVEPNNDLKCDSPAWHMVFSAVSSYSGQMSDYYIIVDHGPVVYLEQEKQAEFINYAGERVQEITERPSEEKATIALFVKDKKYEVQQEYRFVVRIPFHSPSEDRFLLKITKELKEFMSRV